MAKISVPKLSEAREPQAVPEGEYDIRIHAVNEKDSKSGNPMLEVLMVIESEDHPDAAPVREYLMLPRDGDDDEDNLSSEDKQRIFRDNLKIARFCQLFGIEPDGDEIDTEDFEGKTATATLVQEPFSDDSDEMVNRLRLPRLSTGEEDEEEKPKARGRAAPPARRSSKAKAEEEDETEEEAEEEAEDEAEAEEEPEEEEEEEAPPPKRPQRKPAPPARKGRR